MSIHLADAIFWVAVACCSIAQLAIIHSVVISPARMANRETTRARRTAEIAWAVLPGIALVFVFIATWHAMHPTHGAGAVAATFPAALLP